MSGKAEQMLECNYAVIPTDHHDPGNSYHLDTRVR